MEKTHDEEMAIDLWELISALKKRALIILAACLLGGVVAGVYTKLCITPMYTATSSMLTSYFRRLCERGNRKYNFARR